MYMYAHFPVNLVSLLVHMTTVHVRTERRNYLIRGLDFPKSSEDSTRNINIISF